MKILLINKFHYLKGGAERVYFDTTYLLESHGHQLISFSMQHPENFPCKTSGYFMPHVDLIARNGLVSQIKTAGRILYSFEAKKGSLNCWENTRLMLLISIIFTIKFHLQFFMS